MLVTLRQLLDHAAENGYGLPAFNINNLEQGLAILMAAEKNKRTGYYSGIQGCESLCWGFITPSID